jgi:diguanylate cyclase
VEQALTSRRFLGAVGVVVLVTGVVGVWIGLQIGGARVTLWVDDLVTPLAASIACVSCLGACARHDGRMRLFWSLLACATASWTLAEAVWGYYALILNVEVPVPSWADVGYLSAIPLAVAALVVHPATRGSGTRKVRSLFDGLVVATSLLFLSWTLVLGPLARSADLSTSTGVVTLAYPFGDVVIVFFIVRAIRGMTGSNRLSLCCLLAALLAMALTDSAFSYLTEVAKYTGGDVIDTGWVAAYLGIALAAFSSRSSDTTVSPAEHSRPSLASLIAPLLPVLLALTVSAVEIRLGHHLDRAAWLMAVGLIALVLTRQGLMVLELLAPSRDVQAGLMHRLTHAALGGKHPEEIPSPGHRTGGYGPF